MAAAAIAAAIAGAAASHIMHKVMPTHESGGGLLHRSGGIARALLHHAFPAVGLASRALRGRHRGGEKKEESKEGGGIDPNNPKTWHKKGYNPPSHRVGSGLRSGVARRLARNAYIRNSVQHRLAHHHRLRMIHRQLRVGRV